MAGEPGRSWGTDHRGATVSAASARANCGRAALRQRGLRSRAAFASNSRNSMPSMAAGSSNSALLST
ncbi:hypothetical protein C6Q17_22475 [Burkholderia contaminans]|nr:hypothetical protein C6Q17_22475 [Burkholderia contaminans]